MTNRPKTEELSFFKSYHSVIEIRIVRMGLYFDVWILVGGGIRGSVLNALILRIFSP